MCKFIILRRNKLFKNIFTAEYYSFCVVLFHYAVICTSNRRVQTVDISAQSMRPPLNLRALCLSSLYTLLGSSRRFLNVLIFHSDATGTSGSCLLFLILRLTSHTFLLYFCCSMKFCMDSTGNLEMNLGINPAMNLGIKLQVLYL